MEQSTSPAAERPTGARADTPILKRLESIPEIVAGDGCFLREIFHPDRDPVAIGHSLAHARVEPGGRTLEHWLGQSEIYYVIAGSATMYLDGVAHAVAAGSSYYIPSGCRQYLVNAGPERFEFLCIVDPPWSAEQEVVPDREEPSDGD